MVLLIDNYDSFSYNLYQLAAEFTDEIKVIRNDELTVSEVQKLNPAHILISPGPGEPKNAGICEQVILEMGKSIPILGVCLGHQAICEVFGGKIGLAKKLMHGKQSEIEIDNKAPLFVTMPSKIKAARYHSLAAFADTLPECLTVTATDVNGEIMAIEHKQYKIYGVQFHPESILTPDGKTILRNFFAI